ncbi:MAG: class III extradiol ring-cleavage dioxygenase, partial [Methylophilaceae bacterium]|nr:class III extradiol ring-cleavage dioxygenase [Methylophilaceae bacterium]
MKKDSNYLNRLPALFVPHGAPTFALDPGEAGAALADFAREIVRPKAVLVISAHWDTELPTFSAACRPQTIHDFYGFPQQLYAIRYPVCGAVAWAMEARTLLEEAGFAVALDPQRGLDHGAWVPLRMMYPDASVPVVAMSVQSRLGPRHHYRLGQALAPLRDAGVLIVASGNLTHNLGHIGAGRPGSPVSLDYVPAFQQWWREQIEAGDIESLLDYRTKAPGAVEAHPTEEHLLPFFVALGAGGERFAPQAVYSGVEYGMLVMDSYAFWPEGH